MQHVTRSRPLYSLTNVIQKKGVTIFQFIRVFFAQKKETVMRLNILHGPENYF